jgi:hypothetical protein
MLLVHSLDANTTAHSNTAVGASALQQTPKVLIMLLLAKLHLMQNHRHLITPHWF